MFDRILNVALHRQLFTGVLQKNHCEKGDKFHIKTVTVKSFLRRVQTSGVRSILRDLRFALLCFRTPLGKCLLLNRSITEAQG